MTLLIILAVLFAAVALLVVLTERFGKPIDQAQQSKYSKIIIFLVFAVLIAALLKNVM